jgi:hypothetical protein
MAPELAAPPYSAYNDKRRNPPLRSPALGVYRAHNFRISQRTCLKQDTVNIQGWPSRGGIIVLENATPPDFDFLHLDPLDPPLLRSTDQDAEDALCQGLLRLGATWWDSEARYRFIWARHGGNVGGCALRGRRTRPARCACWRAKS